jgi:hypothetical protein
MMSLKNIPWVHALILFAMLAAYPLQVYAATVRISWNPNTEPTVEGYMVYYGTESRSYTQDLDAMNSTTIEIGDLDKGMTYYFAVKAYNDSDMSEYSEEVSVTIPDDSGAGGGGGGGGGCFIATAAL